MRRKKHNAIKKAMRFYRINYGFRPPYKVIVDGNFVHSLESMKRGDAKEQLSKLLSDQVKVFTTKCVMEELRSMGKAYGDTRQACKRYPLHKCGHEEEHVSAAECLLAQLGESNSVHHFLVATQDRGLQRKVLALPGGAVVFASVNGVHLEMPSTAQKKQVKQVEEEHMSVRPQEKLSSALGALGEQEQQGQQGQQGSGNAPAARHKRAKGPNPLSQKPKKKAKAPRQEQAQGAKRKRQQVQGGAAAAAGGEGQQLEDGKRKRVRRRKKGEPAEGGV